MKSSEFSINNFNSHFLHFLHSAKANRLAVYMKLKTNAVASDVNFLICQVCLNTGCEHRDEATKCSNRTKYAINHIATIDAGECNYGIEERPIISSVMIFELLLIT